MKYIVNAKLVLDAGIEWDGVIAVENGRIAACGSRSELPIPADAELLDAKGSYVGPGFVDLHVHGGNGHFFYAEPEAAAEHFLSHGETTILPTLYYDMDKQQLLDAIRRVRQVIGTGAGKAIGGLYMEGPYMNPKYGACADRNRWKGDVCREDYAPLVDEAGTLAKVWAVAPEREGLEPFLEYARAVNPDVVFSAGHSEASPAQLRRLKRYGLCLQTHCMDATGRVEQWLGTRACGPDEACLLDDEMYAEMICDSVGIHVNPELQRLILKTKGTDRVILITDSYVSSEPSPASLSHISDLVFDHNGNLNGSKLTLDVACRNLMHHTDCGIVQAFRMASRNPARIIGMDSELGSIAPGKRANLVFVDDMFHVNAVMLEGEIWPQQAISPVG